MFPVTVIFIEESLLFRIAASFLLFNRVIFIASKDSGTFESYLMTLLLGSLLPAIIADSGGISLFLSGTFCPPDKLNLT